MKEIEKLTVEIRYTISLNDINVSKTVHEQLMNNTVFSMEDTDNDEAFDWLLANIHEDDTYDWTVNIINIE